jgi:hypothetical protein
MTIDYEFGDVDSHGALIRAQVASLEAEHQDIIRNRRLYKHGIAEIISNGTRQCAARRRGSEISMPARFVVRTRTGDHNETPSVTSASRSIPSKRLHVAPRS